MRKRKKWGNQHETGRFTARNIVLVTSSILGLIILIVIGIVGRYYYSHITGSQAQIVNPAVKGTNVEMLTVLLHEKNIEYSAVGEIINETISLEIKEGPKVIFDLSKDIAQQVDTLDTILTRLNIENKEPVLIDLHYTKPIVKF